jgi:dimethylargininase
MKKKLNIFKKKYNIIEVPEGEEIAANSIRINNHLLIPEGFKKTEDLLSKNYNLILLKVCEISKVDAGLSCMSIRW